MTVRESDLIDKIDRAFRRRGEVSPEVRLGMGDDAALFRPRASHEMILTCDWFLEGTHFLQEEQPPDSLGWKCLARAVSDIAAMGGVPRCFLLSLALPDSHTGRWLDEFLAGLRRASRKFGCVLAGGDTTRRREISMNVTVVGDVPTGRVSHQPIDRAHELHLSGAKDEGQLGPGRAVLFFHRPPG